MSSSTKDTLNIVVQVLVAALLLVLVIQNIQKPDKVMSMGEGYYAVGMTNGQAFYGRLHKLGSAFPVLTDVYYIQRRVDKKSGENRSVMIKRGRELHAPDELMLNAQHIIQIEPVAPNSKLMELINSIQAKSKDAVATDATGGESSAQSDAEKE